MLDDHVSGRAYAIRPYMPELTRRIPGETASIRAGGSSQGEDSVCAVPENDLTADE